MKKWKVVGESGIMNHESGIKDLIKILLSNRGIKTKKDADDFLHPKLENITTKNVGIDNKQLESAISRIKKAIKNKEKIVVFGDYDVDGICGTAILWETLNSLGADAMPYIPHRIDEGYGLSIRGIENIKDQTSKIRDVKLIITVDNGIVANKAVEFANKQGIDVIITDHHVPSNPSTGSGLPKAFAIVHTTKLCGAGVAWMLAQEFNSVISNEVRDPNRSTQEQGIPRFARNDNLQDSHLELVALATVADLVPLIGANRTLVKFGLEQLKKTKRIGLLELFKEAGLDKSTIEVYEIGHVVAPRLNAMGRLDYAMDSLRLLCTNNRERAKKLAQVLGSTNKERQTLTIETVEHAKSEVRSQKLEVRSLLFISHESYQQGVIGLVAGKLVEEFYKPSIVVSIGEKYSKASARSVSGFNIIEFIRGASELLVDAGGHPMAAGFTVETAKLSMLEERLLKKSEELLDKELLTRTLKIDCEIPLDFVNENLYDEIQKLSPFGMGNPEPTFVSRKVVLKNMRLVGRENKHLKLQLLFHPEASAEGSHEILRSAQNDKGMIDGIAFGMGEKSREFHIGDKADMAYTIDEDRWNGNRKLQLKIKDMKNNS